MMVSFKNLEEVKETEKAVGVPIKHNDTEKIMWVPKSLIINRNGWRKQKMLDVTDWFYDKKIDELFF